MLVYYVCKIFNNIELSIVLSEKVKINAQKTYNIEANTQTLKNFIKIKKIERY